MDRRTFLRTTGSIAAGVALAGCSSNNTGEQEQTTRQVTELPKPSVEWSGEQLGEDQYRVQVLIEMNDAEKLIIERGSDPYRTITSSGTYTLAGPTIESGPVAGGVRFTVKFEDNPLVVSTLAASQVTTVTSTTESADEPITPPSTQVAFDYDPTNNEVVILHDGGDPLTPDNTGKISITGDVDENDVTWRATVTGTGTSVTLQESVLTAESIATVSNLNSGDTVNVIWNAADGSTSQQIGVWEAP